MFCSECGKKNFDHAKFCVECGTAISTKVQESAERKVNSKPNTKKDHSDIQSINRMSFGESISSCFSKYVTFDGRASQSEYWWFFLFSLLLNWGGVIVEAATPSSNEVSELHILTNLIALVLFLPSIAVGCRRLHDTGRSGWNQLWMFTIIGIIPVLIWLSSKGNDHENKFFNYPISKHKVNLADNKSTEIINLNVAEWKCEKCGESNEEQFSECWKCETSK